MKTLKTTASSGDEISVLREQRNRLQGDVFKLKRRLYQVHHPLRSPEQRETQLREVTLYAESMASNAGAVACARLYTPAWFEADGDHVYLRLLAQYLTARFEKSSDLIETTYAFWSARAVL